jgi:hypothetical protein
MLPVYRPDPINMPTQKKIIDTIAMKRITSILITVLSHYNSTVRCHDYLGVSTGEQILLCPNR